MSIIVSFCAVLFPRAVLDEILDLIESVSEGFHTYSSKEIRPYVVVPVTSYNHSNYALHACHICIEEV